MSLRIAIRRSRRLLARAVLSAALLLAAMPPASSGELAKADRILVLKSQRLLRLLRNGAVLRTYPIALGAHPLGPKRRAGDGRTPEGVYTIDRHLPHSLYHRALHVSYPNDADRARARAAHVDPGDAIVLHGMPEEAGMRDPVRFARDWTDGCIAVGNTAIEEIAASVEDGTAIEIRP